MTFPVQADGASVMTSGEVSKDTPCRKCAYNLRGLAVGGRCPECGTPDGVSVNGDLLRYSDPQYLETLWRGVHFILWGLLAVVVLSFMAAFVGQITKASPVFVQVFIFAASIPSIIGGWLLTTPDPAGIGEDQYGTARKIIRISLIVGATNSLISIVEASGSLSPSAALAARAVALLVSLVGLVGQFAQLAYLRKLAQRIPDQSLSDRARFLMWAIGISYGVLLVLGFLAVLLARAPGPAVTGLGCAAGVLGICLIVFGVMYLFMLGRFATGFREQAELARQTWAIAGQPPVGQ